MKNITLCLAVCLCLLRTVDDSLAETSKGEGTSFTENSLENSQIIRNEVLIAPVTGAMTGALTAGFDILTAGKLWPISWFSEYYFRSRVGIGKEAALARAVSWASYAYCSRNHIQDPAPYALFAGIFLGEYLMSFYRMIDPSGFRTLQ